MNGPPVFQERVFEWGWWHPMWGVWGLGGFAVMLLVMLLFWGLVIAALVLAVRWLIRQGLAPRSGAGPQILRERYARGEINKEEFDAKRRDLGA